MTAFLNTMLRRATKNQIVIIAGFLVLLATATIAASFHIQPAKAACGEPGPFSQECISDQAHQGKGGGWGAAVSDFSPLHYFDISKSRFP